MYFFLDKIWEPRLPSLSQGSFLSFSFDSALQGTAYVSFRDKTTALKARSRARVPEIMGWAGWLKPYTCYRAQEPKSLPSLIVLASAPI